MKTVKFSKGENIKLEREKKMVHYRKLKICEFHENTFFFLVIRGKKLSYEKIKTVRFKGNMNKSQTNIEKNGHERMKSVSSKRIIKNAEITT